MGDLFYPIWTPEYLLDLQHQIATLAVMIPLPFGDLWSVPLRELERVEAQLVERIKSYDSRKML